MGQKQIEKSVLLSEDLQDLTNAITKISPDLGSSIEAEKDLRDDILALDKELKQLSDMLNIPVVDSSLDKIDLEHLEREVDLSMADYFPKAKAFPPMSSVDYTVAAIAGLLSVIIDVVLVGTPDVVKLYKGGENFDGSILTGIIRKIEPGDGTTHGEILKWLSDKCKVPYDISAVKGVAVPNNHRLRSLGHDPFFGLFFAVVDIIMGTATMIDNDGNLRILKSYEVSAEEKLLSVLFYLGHIISDLFTARGIPIPGFFMTQFFTGAVNDYGDSIASIASEMYMNGYDTRHLASMSVPVAVKSLIIEMYWRITADKPNGFLSLAEQERTERNNQLKKTKLLFIANTVGAGGNLIKFVACSCNPCALNAAQWYAFIKSSIDMVKAETRDKSADTILDGRDRINEEWEELLESTENR